MEVSRWRAQRACLLLRGVGATELLQQQLGLLCAGHVHEFVESFPTEGTSDAARASLAGEREPLFGCGRRADRSRSRVRWEGEHTAAWETFVSNDGLLAVESILMGQDAVAQGHVSTALALLITTGTSALSNGARESAEHVHSPHPRGVRGDGMHAQRAFRRPSPCTTPSFVC